MKEISEAAIQMLKSGADFTLAFVLESGGSTPRKAGAGMIIRRDMTIVGTIGGGVVEATVIRRASQVFADKRPIIAELVLEEKGEFAIGSICGGSVKVLIEYFSPDDTRDMAYVEALVSAASSEARAYIAALISDSGATPLTCKCLIRTDGSVISTDIDHVMITQIKTVLDSGDMYAHTDQFQIYLFPVGTDGTVYIFGAGHCGEKLAHFVHCVGFGTVVIDDRSEFANAARFSQADRIIVPQKRDEPFDNIVFGEDSYIVILTKSHVYDEIVLRMALRTGAGYIGMIGSKKKRETIYRHLLDDGYTQDDIKKVHSPIGIEISAESPAEIAVSITSELIKVRAENKTKYVTTK